MIPTEIKSFASLVYSLFTQEAQGYILSVWSWLFSAAHVRLPFASLNAFQGHSVLGSDFLVLLLGQKAKILYSEPFLHLFGLRKFSSHFAVMSQNRKPAHFDCNLSNSECCQHRVVCLSFFPHWTSKKRWKGIFFPFLFCISFLLELETSMKIFLAVFFLPIQSSLLFTVVHMVCFNSSDHRLPADYLLSSLRICTPWKQMVCWRTSLLQCAVGLNALYKNFCCKMKKGCYVVGAPLQKQNLDCVIGKVFLEGTHLYPESKTNNQTFDRHCIVQRIFFLNISVWVLTLQQTYRFNRFKLFCSINIRHTYNEVQQIQLGEISSVGFFSLSQSLIAYAIKIWPFLWGIR